MIAPFNKKLFKKKKIIFMKKLLLKSSYLSTSFWFSGFGNRGFGNQINHYVQVNKFLNDNHQIIKRLESTLLSSFLISIGHLKSISNVKKRCELNPKFRQSLQDYKIDERQILTMKNIVFRRIGI